MKTGPRVRATIKTDDEFMEVCVDVTPWFEQATQGELTALRDAEFQGAPADDVAAFMAEEDPAVADLMEHCLTATEELQAEASGRVDSDSVDAFAGVGYECVVDPVEAEAWLAARSMRVTTARRRSPSRELH